MELAETQCCAVLEISGLSGHKDPKEAMREVLLDLEEHTKDSLMYGEEEFEEIKVPGFITFTGVVSCSSKAHLACPRPCKVGYGEAFEAFIRKERLGMVTRSPGRPNRINHPEHKVKVWVWCPNPRTLNAWWKRKGGGD